MTNQTKKVEQTTLDVLNPLNQKLIKTIPYGGEKEAKDSIDKAYNAFTEWSKLTAYERGALLMKWHQLIEDNITELANLMTSEQGKPIKESIGEIRYANSFISWYAEEGKRVYGETIPSSHRTKRIIVQKQPVGVIAAITPWNFPAAMITRKVAPALAAGCTAVVKPAEETPLTALRLAELAHEAGIPHGVLSVVVGDPGSIGNTWTNDDRVRKISFTGSTEVGKLLMKKSAGTVKKISLELGGHAPFIVMEDGNLDKAVEAAIGAKFRNAGQTCICTNRIYVHESIAEIFTQKFKNAVAKLSIGDGMNEYTDIGPLINKAALDKITAHIQNALDNGAKLEAGGQTINSKQGFFVQPTILSQVSDYMLCMTEETFGPVAPIATFQTTEEVIQRANNSQYGLAAYIFTESIKTAFYVGENLEYGIIGLNDGLPSTAQAPFGGFKESGLGREGGHHGIEEFLEVKYFSIGIE